MKFKGKYLKKILTISTAMIIGLSAGSVHGEDLFSSPENAVFLEEDAFSGGEESESFDESFEEEILSEEEMITEEETILEDEIEFDEFAAGEESLQEEFAAEESEEISEGVVGGEITQSAGASLYAAKEAYPEGSGSKGVKTICDIYEGGNLENQSYSVWSHTTTSYLHYCSNGQLMRVQYEAVDSKILIEYYDTSFNIISSKKVALELPIWGGFHAIGNYYYVVTGQNNTEESDSKEVMRVTKYDKSWNRINSVGVYGANTTIPFDAGGLAMDNYGDLLYIHTSHEMYKLSDGLNHQANMRFCVDTNKMQIVSSNTGIWNIEVGYVSHCFNSFVKIDGNDIITGYHGDAYPRAIGITKSSGTANYGGITSNISNYRALSIPGSMGNNRTGASLGDLQISSSSYLVAGNAEDYAKNSTERNIYVSAINKTTGETTTTWYTNNASTGKTVTTPHLVPVGNDKFMVLWSDYDGTITYALVDHQGKRIGNFYTMKGNLSDCEPIFVNGKLIWYTWNDNINVFYEISVSNMSNDVTVIENGHVYNDNGVVSNGVCTLTCARCNSKAQYAVPTSMNVYVLKNNGQQLGYINTTPEIGEAAECWIVTDYTSNLSNRLSDLEIIISDPSVLSSKRNGTEVYTFKALKPGRTELTIRAKYNPSVCVKKTISVNMIDKYDVSLSENNYICDGKAKTPTVTIKKGDQALKSGTDYKVSYSNNVKCGTATVTATGIGKYAGTVSRTFKINHKHKDNDRGVVSNGVCTLTCLQCKAKVQYAVPTSMTVYSTKNDILYWGIYTTTPEIGETIEAWFVTDYKSSLQDRLPDLEVIVSDPSVLSATKKSGNTYLFKALKAGRTELKIQAKYNPSFGVRTTISVNMIDEYDVSLSNSSYTYDGKAKTPSVTVKNGDKTLKSGTDYKVTYTNNTKAGTATATVTGIGKYAGSVSETFKINPTSISTASIKLSATTVTYNGKGQTPAVTVTNNGVTLVKDKDYKVTYTNNTKPGTATATITGIGNYTGTGKKTYSIKLASSKITSLKNDNEGIYLKWNKVNGAKGYYIYRKTGSNGTYKRIATINKQSTVTYKDRSGKSGTTYYYYVKAFYNKVTSNSKSASIYYLARPSISSLGNSASKTALVKWKKAPSGVRYQIQYSTNSNFKNAKSVYETRNSVTSKKITKLVKGKKYYVRMRIYRKVSNKNYVSSWSKVRTVYIKK